MDGIPIRIDLIGAGLERLRSGRPYPVFAPAGRTGFALALALMLAVAGFAAADEVQPDPVQRARELSWSGDYEESLTLYRSLLEQRPDDPALHREHGLVLLWAGRELDAIQEFEWVLARDPSNAEIRLSLGRAHYYLGDPHRAVDHYEMALPSFEEDPAVIAEAVAVMRAAESDALVEQWLASGLDRHPDHPDLRTVRAAAWVAEGDLDDAERELEAVLAANPDHAGARKELSSLRAERDEPLELARRLGFAGHYAKAKRLLHAHLQKRPDDDDATLTLARFAGWSADYPESQALFRRLLQDRPDDRQLRTELAEVTSWRGQYDEAHRLFASLIEEDPADMRTRLGMANVHLWTGNHRGADRDLRQILAEAPGHEEAAKQLQALSRLRAPSLEPRLLWFSDSENFTLWNTEAEFHFSPRPGRGVWLRLDAPQVDGDVIRGFDSVTGEVIRDSESSTGFGFRAGLTERPDRRYEFGGEIGGVTYTSGGFSPRLRAWVSFWPSYRHLLQLDLRHEDALPEMRSIETALEGIERSTLFLVHSYMGERFTSWTRLEAGRFSDDPYFWTVRTVLGYSLLRQPIAVDVLALATAGDFSEQTPSYYSPEDLLSYGVGIRLKKRIADRADLLLIGEVGRVHSDGTDGNTFRLAPELKWELTPDVKLSLRYDHYESLRFGSDYESDLVTVSLRYRWPASTP